MRTSLCLILFTLCLGWVADSSATLYVYRIGGAAEGEPGNLGSLTWSGSRDDGAEVELTMRSGSDDDPQRLLAPHVQRFGAVAVRRFGKTVDAGGVPETGRRRAGRRLPAAGVDTIILSSPTDPDAIDTLDVSDVARVDSTGFVIALPAEYRRDPQSSLIPIQVIFRAQVFQYGTVFRGRVFDSTREWEVHQLVAGGDADPLVDGNTVSVTLTETTDTVTEAVALVY